MCDTLCINSRRPLNNLSVTEDALINRVVVILYYCRLQVECADARRPRPCWSWIHWWSTGNKGGSWQQVMKYTGINTTFVGFSAGNEVDQRKETEKKTEKLRDINPKQWTERAKRSVELRGTAEELGIIFSEFTFDITNRHLAHSLNKLL